MLAGDRGQVVDRGIDFLRVLDRLADTDIDDDLVEARHLQRVLVAELLHQSRLYLAVIALLKTGHWQGFIWGPHLSMTSPERRATRTLRPPSRNL